MKNKPTFKEKLLGTCICLMKHNEEEYIVCLRNDILLWIINHLGIDLDQFFDIVADAKREL